jgi:hypothetical protein
MLDGGSETTVETLVVRPLIPTDFPSLRRMRGYDTRLDAQPGNGSVLPAAASHIAAAMPLVRRRNRVYVAMLDGVPCASVTTRPQAHRYRWDVVSLAADPHFLDGDQDDCKALWTALLECAIRQAGESGAKRLFASASEDGIAYGGLRSAAFEPYALFWTVSMSPPSDRVSPPEGFRAQDESDVWSIHQLYHHVTPVGVQHAEARTSAAWEIQNPSPLKRISSPLSQNSSFVVETREGIVAYCSIQKSGPHARAQLLIEEGHRQVAYPLLVASARAARVRLDSHLNVAIPAYMSDMLRQFVEEGCPVVSERVALIRYTTSSAHVRYRALASHQVEVAERVPRGVPTYYQPLEEPAAAVSATRCRRTE